jgi:hypothetical protein
MALCGPCHDIRTRREAREGVGGENLLESRASETSAGVSQRGDSFRNG